MNEKEQIIADWIAAAQKTLANDKGARTALRRVAGTKLAVANGGALAEFYKLPSLPVYLEEPAFETICIMCLWEAREWEKGVPFIQAANKALTAETKENFGKKIKAILDLPIDEDGYFLTKLYRMIKLVKSKGVIIDAAQLMYDLLYWEHEKRFVQRRWVKEFYQNNHDIESEGETHNAD